MVGTKSGSRAIAAFASMVAQWMVFPVPQSELVSYVTFRSHQKAARLNALSNVQLHCNRGDML